MPRLATNKQLLAWSETNTVNLIYFGCGYICDKTMQRSGAFPDEIWDNNPDAHGQQQENVTVKEPSSTSIEKNIYVITTTSINEVHKQLISSGASEDIIFVSPVLREHFYISGFENQHFDILFSSGLQNRSQESCIEGGGLYRLEGTFEDFAITKVLSGASHGIKHYGDKIFVVNEIYGVVCLNHDLAIIETYPLPHDLRPHGIDYCEQSKQWVLACSYADGVAVLDDNFKFERLIKFSEKSKIYGGKAQHHTNDVVVWRGRAYCSMFSLTGDYKRGIYDGGVLVVDLDSGAVVESHYGNLSHPHNICMHDNEFWILDSFHRKVYRGTRVISEGYTSFLRGIDFVSDSVILLGQSKNRNFQTVSNGYSSPVFLDTAIVVLDLEQNLAKTFPLPSSISEIHAISSIQHLGV